MPKGHNTVAAAKFYLRPEGTLVIEPGLVGKTFIIKDTQTAVNAIMRMEPAWILRSGMNVSDLKKAVEEARVKVPDTMRRQTGRSKAAHELESLQRTHGDNWRIAADIDLSVYEHRAKSADVQAFMRPFWAGWAEVYKEALAETAEA